MKKIIFVLSAIESVYRINRIEEFVTNGYDVDVYGFSRPDLKLNNTSYTFKINVLCEFPTTMIYYKRIPIMYKAIRNLKRKYKNCDNIWYYFGADVTFIASMIDNKPYIYDECDLVHTYFPSLLKNIFERIDRKNIEKSLLYICGSEGFMRYHYGDDISKYPKNVYPLSIRLNKNILNFSIAPHKKIDLNHLSIAFIGIDRFDSISSMVKIILSNFSNYSFHIYGEIEKKERYNEIIKKYKNFIYHGRFKNPEDLSQIYSDVDLVVATYDIKYENVRYAEPSKIYETIYFETPIIVSKQTWISEKVTSLNVGYSVDPFNEEEIVAFFKNLTEKSINEKIEACRNIDKKSLLNINDVFFDYLKKIIKS